MKLYLDSGHGGVDSGAVGNGLLEKNVVLEMAKKLKTFMQTNYKNIEIMETRTTDVFVSLDERTKRANDWGADVFLSLHLNANTITTAKGFETYIYPEVDSKTVSFQNVVHEEVMKQIAGYAGVVDRGKKRANFHVLRESNMIALLGENLFISNTSDSSLLKQSSFLDSLVRGYAFGMEKFFGLEKNIPPPSDKLYQVIAGTFSIKDNADKLAEKLNSMGIQAYVSEKD